MRNLLALLAAGLLTFIGLGWYLGWYQVHTAPGGGDGTKQININLNTKKIAEDVGKGKNKLRDLLNDEPKGTTVNSTSKPVEAQPTSRQSSLQFNDDGSITYRGDFPPR